MHVVPPIESMNKLGEQYGTFAFNAEPLSYKNVWKSLVIEFQPSDKTTTDIIPDISENFGRLFISEKAYQAFNNILAECGEFLPVTYDGGQGYIFNPLVSAEQHNAVDDKLLSYDQYGNLEHLGFIEERLKNVSIFKSKLDTYKGIFCFEDFMKVYEKAKLTGISFHPDLANPIGKNCQVEQ